MSLLLWSAANKATELPLSPAQEFSQDQEHQQQQQVRSSTTAVSVPAEKVPQRCRLMVGAATTTFPSLSSSSLVPSSVEPTTPLRLLLSSSRAGVTRALPQDVNPSKDPPVLPSSSSRRRRRRASQETNPTTLKRVGDKMMCSLVAVPKAGDNNASSSRLSRPRTATKRRRRRFVSSTSSTAPSMVLKLLRAYCYLWSVVFSSNILSNNNRGGHVVGASEEATIPPPPGTIPCNNEIDDAEFCTTMVGPGSVCHKGLCSNPFVSGCLRALLGQETEKPKDFSSKFNSSSNPQDTDHHTATADPTQTLRVCNSQDDEHTITNHLCQRNPLEYMEIRILTGNWESSLLTAWALQIVLSEWMQVPTSIESSSPEREANFYHPTNRFEYGATAYDYTALEVAHQVGDCTKRHDKINEDKFVELQGDTLTTTTTEETEGDEYRPCAHIMPEVWNGQTENLWNLTQRRIIEAPEGNGVVGKLTWYIPKQVAEARPDYAHYSGWARNASQVAMDFLSPMTWSEYCTNISLSNCTSADDYVTRPPETESEQNMYYDMPGNGAGFKGYFTRHQSVQQDCDSNNNSTTCSEIGGEFVDFPCDWSSFAVPQAYHLGIAVQSRGTVGVNGGYTYGEKLQIWSAANATGNFVVMNWYTPDPTYQWYRGTEAEFQEVQLPPPSPECVQARVSVEERCSDDPMVRVGSPEGACGAETQTLEKVVVQNLYHTIYGLSKDRGGRFFRGGAESSTEKVDQSEADATRSPAYEAVKSFHLSEFDIGKMFEDWRDRLRARGHSGYNTFDGTTGADPRHVVCQWVADNAAHLQTFVPFTYPRVLQEDDPYNTAIAWVAWGVGVLVAACILSMGVVTYILRDKPAFKAAQLPFLYMVLLGLLAISCGGIVYALSPESGTCVARIWLINMGYTLEMSPLIVKIAAISKMLQAARKMRRVTISRQTLFGVVGGICLLAASYLTAWTIVDPPSKARQLTLQLDDGDYEDSREQDPSRAWWQIPATPISMSYYCRSPGSAAWFTLGLTWQCLLLICAAVLAMQTRRMQRRWNESRSLAIMIYTQAGFVLIRFLMWLLEEPSGVSVQMLDILRSFVFSLDALLALLIYFGSKLHNVYYGDDAEAATSGPSRRDTTFVSGITHEDSRKRIHVKNNSGLSHEASRSSLLSARTVSQYLLAIGEAPSRSFAFDSAPFLPNGGVIETSSRAGDIMVSQASSRRLIASTPMLRDSETAPLCPKCREPYKNDPLARSELETTEGSPSPIVEEKAEIEAIKLPEPIQEEASTYVTNEEDSSHSSS